MLRGDGAMIQQLRAPVAFVHGLGLFPSMHMVAQFWGIGYLLLTSIGTRHTCGTCVYMQVKHSYT